MYHLRAGYGKKPRLEKGEDESRLRTSIETLKRGPVIMSTKD